MPWIEASGGLPDYNGQEYEAARKESKKIELSEYGAFNLEQLQEEQRRLQAKLQEVMRRIEEKSKEQ